MALQQLQQLPVGLTLPSLDPREQEPIHVRVDQGTEEDDSIGVMLRLRLRGLGDVEVRLKSPPTGDPVRALLRAKDVHALQALRDDLETLRQSGREQGIRLSAAAAPLPLEGERMEEGSFDLKI